MLFQHRDLDAGARQQKPQHHAGRAAADDAAPNRAASCFAHGGCFPTARTRNALKSAFAAAPATGLIFAMQKSLFWPTCFAIGAFLVLAGLGTWQLERLGWKEGLIAERAAGLRAAPARLPQTLSADLDFHRVRIGGHFLPGQLHLHALHPDGKPDFHQIAAFASDDGRTILIDRGFAKDANPAGEMEVSGLLRVPPATKPSFVPLNRPDTNEWFFFDLAAMARAAGAGAALPLYLDTDPQAAEIALDLPNNHLQYAITWYALAAGLVAVYILLIRRHRRGDAI
jgi:surfeit locus 1 family protein